MNCQKGLLLALLSIFFSGCTNEVDLGDGFVFFPDNGFIGYWRKGDTLSFDVPSDVVYYINTKKVLIIKQNRRDKEYAIFGKTDYPNEDSVFYWIIEKDKPSVYGPLIEAEFRQVLIEKEFGFLNQHKNSEKKHEM